MFEEILFNIMNYELLGNNLMSYFIFFFSLLMAWPIGKSINFILNNYIKKWTAKSKIKFDDILFNSVNPSINMFAFAGCFYAGSRYFIGNFVPILDKVFNFLIIIPIVYFMIKFSTEFIGIYLKESKSGKKNEAGIDLLIQIIRISLFIVGLLMIMSNLGYNVSALLAGLGVGGLAFALAAQDLLKNFFSGIAIIFDKTFNKGEIVKFDGKLGIIDELKLRTTKIKTYDGTVLTVPNSTLSDNIVENITKAKKVKVNQTIGVTYDTSTAKLEKAKTIIENAINADPDTDHENFWVWFDEFNSYSLDIKIIYYGLMSPHAWPEKVLFKERVNFEIKREFEKAKIDMAFPTQTVEVIKK